MSILSTALARLGYEKRSVTVGPTTSLGLPYPSVSPSLAMQLSAVYRCVEVISDAIASQAWQVLEYDKTEGFVHNPFHQADYILNTEPNKSMSRFTLMKTGIALMLLEGNAYIEIIRDPSGNAQTLILNREKPFKSFIRPDHTIYHLVGKNQRRVEGENMIHLMNFSYDGLVGVSTLTHAINATALAQSSEASAKGFFSGGANMSGILTSASKLTPQKADAIKAAWAGAFDVDSGTPGGIAVMEAGLDFKPVTVNPRDAQMLETRGFNVIEICRFFGVSPSKVFDSQNLTYSNIESFQLGFLTDTISPLDAKIENEFNRKVFRPSQRRTTKLALNIEDLLRANLDAQANYTSKLFQAGGYTVNEVRKRTGMPKYNHPNADMPMIQVNMQPVPAFQDHPKEDPKKPLIKKTDE